MQKRKWLATEKIYGGSQLGREKGKKERMRERGGWWKTTNEPDDRKYSLAVVSREACLLYHS